MSTSKECEGHFKIVYDKATEDVTIKKEDSTKNGEIECVNEAEWRVTYFHDTGLEPINCCMRCINKVSILNLMYSAVRLKENRP